MTRFHSCKNYGKCLDDAAYANGTLVCEGCRDFAPVQLTYEESISDAQACRALILRVIAGDKGINKHCVFNKRHRKPKKAEISTIEYF